MSVVTTGSGAGSTVDRGIGGNPGQTGPQGTPGVAAVVKQLSTAVVKSRAVQSDPAQAGKIRAATDFATTPFAGIATATGSSGSSQAIQHHGPVDPNDGELGAGTACAVGCKADGAPCRVTDPACVSACNIIGWCDTAGTIFVQPCVADVVNVLDHGFDPTGATALDAALANLFTNLNTSAWAQAVIYFPEGIYRFDSPWPSVPSGCWIEGAGNGAYRGPRYSSGAGTMLAFFGSGTAILFQTQVAANAAHGGGIRNLTVLSGNSNGWASCPSIANIGIEIIGDPAVTIEDVRFGSFKYQISVDGGEVTWVTRPRFDGGPFKIGATSYDGYADMATDRDQVLSGPVSVTVDPATNTYTRASGSFLTDGLRVGMCGTWFGFGDPQSNGPKLIVALSATVMQVTEARYNIAPYVGVNETATASFDCFDSAVSCRIGEWQFPIAGSANSVHLTRPYYNSGRWGSWHRGGIGHYVQGLCSEVRGGFAVIDGAEQIHFSEGLGEAYDLGGKGGIWVRHGGSAIGLSVRAMLFAKNRPAILNDGTIYGLSVSDSNVYACYGVGDTTPGTTNWDGSTNPNGSSFWPLEGSGYYLDVSDGGGNTYSTAQRALSAADYGTSGYGQDGTAINHVRAPIASLDVLQISTLPARTHRMGASVLVEERAPLANGGQNEVYRRVYGANRPVATVGGAMAEKYLDTTDAPATIALVDVPNYAGGWVFATVVGNSYANDGSLCRFKIKQAFKREDSGTAAISLIGTPTVLESDDLDGAFPVPVLVAVGTGAAIPSVAGTVGIALTVAPHPTKGINWGVTIELQTVGR